MKIELKTTCAHCQKVLTDSRGRHHNTNFNSDLKNVPMTVDTVYAYCDECYPMVCMEQGVEE